LPSLSECDPEDAPSPSTCRGASDTVGTLLFGDLEASRVTPTLKPYMLSSKSSIPTMSETRCRDQHERVPDRMHALSVRTKKATTDCIAVIPLPPKLGAVPWAPGEGMRVEWTVRNLSVDYKCMNVTCNGVTLQQGKYISSPTFTIAGVEGSLRFWPNGFFNYAQKRERDECTLGGLLVHSWCAIGLFMPHGMKLRLRFFVGDAQSNICECYWDGGALARQIWTPDAREPPCLKDFVVGVEVLRDLRHHLPRADPRRKHGASRPGTAPDDRPKWAGLAKQSAMHKRPQSEGSFRASKVPSSRASITQSSRASTFDRLTTGQGREDLDQIVQLHELRTAAGLALPSSRFMCPSELRRLPPRCSMRSF